MSDTKHCFAKQCIVLCKGDEVLGSGTLSVACIVFVLDPGLGFCIGTDRINLCYKMEFIKLDYTVGPGLFNNDH